MKKLGIVSMALALVTMGGVYATWSFADSNSGTAEKELAFTMEGVTTSTSRGQYEIIVEPTNAKMFSVDQTSATDHTAALKITENAKVVVKFTPNAGAAEDIKNYGLLTTLSISIVGDGTYKIDENGNYDENGTATNIFKITDNENKQIVPLNETVMEGEGKKNWTSVDVGEDGSIDYFTLDIPAETLATLIAFNREGGFIIDTITEYHAFSKCLDSIKFKLTVSDPTAADQQGGGN